MTLMRASTIALVAVVVAFFALIVLRVPLPFWRVEATLHPTVSVVGRTVYVTGTTDLPDGAFVTYYYENDVAQVGPNGGTATIHDGRFEFETDFKGYSGGVLTVYVGFNVAYGGQPQVVLDRFGAWGERLSGP